MTDHQLNSSVWSEPKAFPPGEVESPLMLRKPDQPMADCSCTALNLTYNPNEVWSSNQL